MSEPIFTAEDISFLQRIADEHEVTDEMVLDKEHYRQQRLVAEHAIDLGGRIAAILSAPVPEKPSEYPADGDSIAPIQHLAKPVVGTKVDFYAFHAKINELVDAVNGLRSLERKDG